MHATSNGDIMSGEEQEVKVKEDNQDIVVLAGGDW